MAPPIPFKSSSPTPCILKLNQQGSSSNIDSHPENKKDQLKLSDLHTKSPVESSDSIKSLSSLSTKSEAMMQDSESDSSSENEEIIGLNEYFTEL